MDIQPHKLDSTVMEKEEEIEKAYGDYWKYVKEDVDGRGWCIKSGKASNMYDVYYEINVGEINYEKTPVRKWRPKILSHLLK